MSIVTSLRFMIHGDRSFFEESLSPDAMAQAMQDASIPGLSFYFMMLLATAIATFGLIANSAPAIIGAMIIAPLMGPIISLSYGMVVIDWQLMARSTLAVVSGVVVVVLFAFVSTKLIGIRIAGSEILSRTSPTLLDLGIAVAAGAAGAFAQTRRSILSSIAGVSIAVALVPPLAVTGIGLALGGRASAAIGMSLTKIGHYSGGESIALGAFLLFLTNLIGIVLFSGIIFICNRYGHWKRALVGLMLLAGITLFISQPLSQSLNRLYVKSAVVRLTTTLAIDRPDLIPGTARIESIQVQLKDHAIIVEIDLLQLKQHVTKMQEAVDAFQEHLSARLKDKVVVKANITPVELISLTSTNNSVSEEDSTSP